ncbi:unnamed protein product [Eruca vesicaria subsp. sativa]|uniref:Uncharacterized protein n=1 Tax=Eruca vesicaria subsp. sativa TaxID=29727 RepID=A0ABC8LTM8_ERUVS|nr:unnamed protein product [Eruca vesicaria subsp. sativa]
MNESRNDGLLTGDDNDPRLHPLSLSLRPPTSYSPQIAPVRRLAPSSHAAPPLMMQTWPRFPSSQPYFTTLPPSYLFSSSLSYSPYQTLSRESLTPIQPPYTPSFDFLPPERPVTAVESRRSYRSQSSRKRRYNPPHRIPGQPTNVEGYKICGAYEDDRDSYFRAVLVFLGYLGAVSDQWKSYLKSVGIDWWYLRKHYGSRAVYGGFVATLKKLKLCVD